MFNSRIVFIIKDGYKLELQAPETMKLFDRTKKIIHKRKNGENVLSFEVVEVVLVQCSFVDNQCQKKFEMVYTFQPNKSYAYLLNGEGSKLMFWKAYNTEFDEVIIQSTGQNGRPLELEDQVNLTFLISKQE